MIRMKLIFKIEYCGTKSFTANLLIFLFLLESFNLRIRGDTRIATAVKKLY